MDWREGARLDGSNRQAANVYECRGSLEGLADYLCPGGEPQNFIISGGAQYGDQLRPLGAFFDSVVGRLPVIVLHNNDWDMVSLACESWESSGCTEDEAPLWVVDSRSPGFEPLYGMDEMQLSAALRQLAKKLGYTVTPRFEKVVRAHTAILSRLELPISLTGLRYLCGFEDMGEFHGNIMSLPGDEAANRRIWSDLGTDLDPANNQFDLFRAVIGNLAQDAAASGWSAGGGISGANCIQAALNGATLLLPVSDTNSELLLPYLAEELRAIRRPFILIVDKVKLCDEHFLKYLSGSKPGGAFGIVADSVVDLVDGDEDAVARLADRVNTLLILKHGTGRTAAVLSELLGRFDYTKAETGTGTSRGFLKLLPRDRHVDVRYSTENRYRIMPEEMTSLGPGQAIVFDTGSNEIIRYN